MLDASHRTVTTQPDPEGSLMDTGSTTDVAFWATTKDSFPVNLWLGDAPLWVQVVDGFLCAEVLPPPMKLASDLLNGVLVKVCFSLLKPPCDVLIAERPFCCTLDCEASATLACCCCCALA